MMVFSFLSSKILIELDEKSAEFRPGEAIKGRVRLHTFRKLAARKFHIVLCCAEWMGGGPNGNEEDGKEITLWKKDIKLGESGEYGAGAWDFEFRIPPESVPTIACEAEKKFCSKGAGVKWFLHAQMDVPSSLDLHAYKRIFVY
ncbi:MAG: hypothetical protein QXH30_02790 [Candidatus Bilamarchaeaceae archaeon]